MTDMTSLQARMEASTSSADFSTSVMSIEIGPAHPAMHGIVRFTTHLDGELIVGMDPEIGYLIINRLEDRCHFMSDCSYYPENVRLSRRKSGNFCTKTGNVIM